MPRYKLQTGLAVLFTNIVGRDARAGIKVESHSDFFFKLNDIFTVDHCTSQASIIIQWPVASCFVSYFTFIFSLQCFN